jgi:hypothetical protein
MPSSAALPSMRYRSPIASTAGTITAPAWTGPPSKVSSKSSPCAAVPLPNAAPAALSAAVADRGAGPVLVPAGERAADIVLVARGDAEADHIDQRLLALLALRRRQLSALTEAMRSARCSAIAMSGSFASILTRNTTAVITGPRRSA